MQATIPKYDLMLKMYFILSEILNLKVVTVGTGSKNYGFCAEMKIRLVI
jgi:hypothetical protein